MCARTLRPIDSKKPDQRVAERVHPRKHRVTAGAHSKRRREALRFLFDLTRLLRRVGAKRVRFPAEKRTERHMRRFGSPPRECRKPITLGGSDDHTELLSTASLTNRSLFMGGIRFFRNSRGRSQSRRCTSTPSAKRPRGSSRIAAALCGWATKYTVGIAGARGSAHFDPASDELRR